jgi:capsular exopolysaccharide synthesis family protein
VTSPSQGEGKSFITTNLAVAFAEMGRRTLLIDGDTRRGDAHRLLGLERSPGLTDYLRDRNAGEVIQSTEYPTLDYIACGTRGTTTPELLASSEMSAFMGTLRRAYDVILVDSPPLAAGADPIILASLTGNLVVVIRTGSTEKQLAAAKLDVLGRLPVRVLGAVLNDVEDKGVYRYYYDYLPDYQPEAEEDDETPKVLAETQG